MNGETKANEIERMREALEWYATAQYPDDGSGRPPEAYQRRAKEVLCAAQLKQPASEPCDVCDGAGIPVSGLPCICNGSGLMSIEVIELRKLLYGEPLAGVIQETPTLELERVATRLVEDLIDEMLLRRLDEAPDIVVRAKSIVLSALKQVQREAL